MPQRGWLSANAARVAVGERALDPSGQCGRTAVVDEDCRVAGDLRERAGPRRDDRRAARHRLERGQAKPLVAGREDEAGGAAVEGGELLPWDVALELDTRSEADSGGGALGVGAAALVRAGEDQPQLRVVEQRQRLDRGVGVLAGL